MILRCQSSRPDIQKHQVLGLKRSLGGTLHPCLCYDPPCPLQGFCWTVFATSKRSVQKPMIFLMLDFVGPCLCYIKAVCVKAKKTIKGKCPPRRCVLMLLDFVGSCLCYVKAVCAKAKNIIPQTARSRVGFLLVKQGYETCPAGPPLVQLLASFSVLASWPQREKHKEN